MREHYSHAHRHAGEALITLSDNSSFDSVFNDFLSQIHSGDLADGQIHRGMYDQISSQLTDALTNEIGTDSKLGDPHNRLSTYIRSNIFQFSAAKTLAEHRAFADQVTDADGKIKSFSQFRKDVEPLANQFNEDYLNTEYNNVVASAQAATKWADIERDQSVLPFLEYRTMEDDRVRPEHAVLDGKVARVDDPVWDAIYPPNDWGCRCTVLQLDEGDGSRQEQHSPITNDEADSVFNKNNDQFKNNVGKSGLAFTAADPTIDATGASNINQFDAETYGLNSPDRIENWKDLPERVNESGVEGFTKAWQQNLKDAGIGGDRFIAANDFTQTKVVFGSAAYKNILHGDQSVSGNLLTAIRNADEVWVNNAKKFNQPSNQYVFIKYYQDKPVVVIAKMNVHENYLEASDAFTLKNYSDKNLSKYRRGVLLVAKK